MMHYEFCKTRQLVIQEYITLIKEQPNFLMVDLCLIV